MKKQIIGALALSGIALTLASCNVNVNNPSQPSEGSSTVETKEALGTPLLTKSEKTVSWEAISNATGYIVNVNGTDLDAQTATTYAVTETKAGDYVIKVKAITTNTAYKNSEYSNTVTVTVEEKNTPIVLIDTKLWVVGDSTVSSFTDDYYLPRYGYGTQLNTVLDSKVTVENLALSGRSSRSFLTEANYETLTSGIKSGDYLVIGFGHNDEKSDDAARYAAPTLDAKDTEKTGDAYNFQYILNEYYIEMAIEKGATPILCTPIVRLSNKDDYSGSNGHITSDGDYSACIKDLGEDTGTTVIDLTALTKEKYTTLGYEEAKKYHAVTSCKYDEDGTTIIPNYGGLDGTHINKYGAKEVAYLFGNALKNTTNSLKNYVLANIAEPTALDYNDAINKDKKPLSYQAVDWTQYQAADHFSSAPQAVLYNEDKVAYGLCGTAFGDTGGNPASASNGFVAKEVSTGVYQVGQSKTSATYYKGKISSSTYGIAYLFYQVDKNYNFTMSVSAKITTQNSDDKQAGFGLMLRDDCYEPVQDQSILSNYVAAGILNNNAGKAIVNFSEVNCKRVDEKAISATLAVDDEATFTIKRLGQVVTCTTVFKGVTYTSTYTDFDFVAIDSNYMYIGMFGSRGIIAEYSNVTFTIDGVAQSA